MSGSDAVRRPGRLHWDVCRCHDDRCPARAQCRRYLDRDYAGPQTPHAMTHRDPGCDECGWRVPA
jgi:hypothetical protein